MADTLGTRIMKLRGDKTQQQLADALNVSRSLVKAWENDDRPVRSDDLVKLSSLFGVSCDYLLGLVDEDNATNDEKLRAVSEYTGLSNDAIISILNFRKFEPKAVEALSCLLERRDYWSIINYYLQFAISSMHIHKTVGVLGTRSKAERITMIQDALTMIDPNGEVGNILLDDGTFLNTPKGTLLLSAHDACDFYKARAEKGFSMFLDSYIETASGKSIEEGESDGKH